jgi:hypothetical protein
MRRIALGTVKGYRQSALSRCAEQLGFAIRQVAPSAVEPGCVRNAWNSFKYVDPQTLPDNAPASALCAEVHSFSRVFTGAFYEILSGMLGIRSKTPTEADLGAVAADFGRLLTDAIAAAPVQPNYFAQVASHIIDADTARFAGKYRAAFAKRRIIPKAAVDVLQPRKRAAARRIAKSVIAARPVPERHKVTLSAEEFGLGSKRLVMFAPLERKPFFTMSAGLGHARGESEVHAAAHRFVRMLFARNRVDTESDRKKIVVTPDTPRAKLKKRGAQAHAPPVSLRLRRRRRRLKRA